MLRRLLVLLILMSLVAIPVAASPESGDLAGKKICLDPGHGGTDPGAVYDDWPIYLEEADINLDVAYGLKALLEESGGATVVMARTDDSYKDNRDRYTFCNAEEADILVSVHTNSVDDPTWDGSMALYFHTDDRILAQTMLDRMLPYLRDRAPDPANFLSFGLSKFASGVLLKSNMPAAMMEPLFMSNPAEATLLVTTIYEDFGVTPNPGCVDCRRAQIAQTLYDGVLDYFGAGGNLPPTVSITAPADGAVVSGEVALRFDATDSEDPLGTLMVEWNIDGGAWQPAAFDSGSGLYEAMWDSASVGDGNHTIAARATDSAGATGGDSIAVTVGNGGGSMTLSAVGYKVRGFQKVDLAWSGAVSSDVDIYRDGSLITTTSNDGAYTDDIGRRGLGSYTYQVCESGTGTCSNQVTVNF